MASIAARTGLGVMAVCLLAVLQAGSAGGSPAAVSFGLELGASTSIEPLTGGLTANGGTVSVPRLAFYAKIRVTFQTTTQPAGAKVRVRLGDGLRWGADDPDPSEACTSTPTTGECSLGPYPGNITATGSDHFAWDVVAAAQGHYSFSGELVELTDTDTNMADNASSITIAVSETGPGGGGSGGTGGGTAVAASAVRLSPARPKAGSALVASVRVTRGGSPVRPSRVACTASLGGAKLKGSARASSGAASCLFRTPKSAKGKRLAGSVSFRAGGAAFTKRFAARLG